MVSRYLIFFNFDSMIDIQVIRQHLVLVSQLVQLIKFFICFVLLGEKISSRRLYLLVVKKLSALRQIEHPIIWKSFRVLIVYYVFYQWHSLLPLARLVIISYIDSFKRHKAFRSTAILSLLLHGVLYDRHDVFERPFALHIGAIVARQIILTRLLFGWDDSNLIDEFFTVIW